MRCLECKIAKFDIEQHKWVCPACPYVEIDLYTVHRDCDAKRWYLSYVCDTHQCTLKVLASQRLYEGILSKALDEARTVGVQQSLIAELEDLAARAQLRLAVYAKQADALRDEIVRLKKNGLA